MARGGYREGAGRPKGTTKEIKGKNYTFWLYPEEKEKVKEYIKQLKESR